MRHQKQTTFITSAEDGCKYTIQMTRFFLRTIGVWPLALCETRREKLGCAIVAAISSFLLLFLFIPCILCTFLMKTDLITKLRFGLGASTYMLMAVAKQYILLTRSKSITECIIQIRKDWDRIMLARETDLEIMLDNVKFGRRLSIVCTVSMYTAHVLRNVLPFVKPRTQIIGNETVRLLLYPVYRGLFDVRNSPYFEITQIVQMMGGYVIYTLTISACSIAAVFVMHTRGQIRILMLKMDDLADGKKRQSACNTTSAQRLGDIVRSHVSILRYCTTDNSIRKRYKQFEKSFVARTDDLLNKMCFADVFGYTFLICFLSLYTMTVWEQRKTIETITFFLIVTCFTFNTFIFCYIGDVLAEECLEIGIKSYMIDWYRLPGKEGLGIMLMMQMSNATIKLTAGKFMDLSLASFCSIMKTALAYLNLLRTFT